MNILVITQMYSQPDDIGDNKPTKTVNYFVREWSEMGHKVIVMHCPSRFPLLLYLLPAVIKEKVAGRISTMVPSTKSRKNMIREENGTRIYRLPMLKFKPGQAYSKLAMSKQAKKMIKHLKEIEFTPDLILGHFANPSLELVVKLSNYYNSKSSIVFHHDCTESNIKKYRIQENISNVGAVGARSIIEAKQIKERLHLERMPFVCCSGVPNDAVKAANKNCDKQNFKNGIRYLYVGSLIKRKHLDVVIKAFVKIAKANDTLTVIGGGPEEDNLKQLVKELNTEKNVIFLGRISRDRVLQEMKKAQVFTLISHGETYGMVYIEAMLQGCLTIASRGEGFDGIIKDNINGFICEPGDQTQLEIIYKRINSMSTEKRNQICESAIATALHFSEREVAEKYLSDIIVNQNAYQFGSTNASK